MNACEALDPGMSLEEGQETAKILTGAGADAIHVSAYTLPINKKITDLVTIRVGALPVRSTPPGPFLGYAAAIKREVKVPVIAVGKLHDPTLASSAIVDGRCDMIALARQLICDPYWSLKVESGKADEIIYCNYCNSCHTAQQRGEDVFCAKNLNLCGEPSYRRLRQRGRRRA
jgi:2,4-dienoyl-CoA reductase (NADPH2)